MNFLLAGGGSIGHVAPCVAVARALQSLDPENGIHLVCANRPDDRAFLEKECLSYTALPIPRPSLLMPFPLIHGFLAARRLLRSQHPSAVLCKGGGISVPVALAAARLGIPLVLHESDAVGGRGTAFLARWARIICLGMPFDGGNPLLQTGGSKLLLTGNPVRPAVTAGKREEGLRVMGFAGDRPILLVMGGSQGSQALNTAVLLHLPALLKMCDVIHLTGTGKEGAPPQPHYRAIPFAQEELPHFYACADLAVSRGGAGSIAELAANGIPAILVPLRDVAQDHQEANARATEENRGCVRLEQDDLHALLLPTIERLLGDRSALRAMGDRMRLLFRPDAAKDIAAALITAAKA